MAVAGPLSGSAATKPKRERLWIEVGKDDFLLKRNEEFLASLKDKGVHHERHLTEGKLIPTNLNDRYNASGGSVCLKEEPVWDEGADAAGICPP